MALTLAVLGVPDEAIVDDYALSEAAYKELADRNAMVGALAQVSWFMLFAVFILFVRIPGRLFFEGIGFLGGLFLLFLFVFVVGLPCMCPPPPSFCLKVDTNRMFKLVLGSTVSDVMREVCCM